MTVDEIIADLGGPAEIARATNISDGAIRQWKFRRCIPRRAWPDLIQAFPAKVSLETLGGTEAKAA